MDGVRRCELTVHAIKNVLLVSFRVHDRELRWIEETSGVESAGRDEVSPLVASIGEIETDVGSAERAVGGGQVPGRLLHSLARAGSEVDDHAGLLSILSRRRAGNHFHRLHGVEWDLVGESLALLVAHRLAVDGERI